MKNLLLVLLSFFILTGCDKVVAKRLTADEITSRRQEHMMREAVAQSGQPAVTNFQEKKMLKMLYELRDQEGLVCHAYLMNQMTGKIGQYLGKCLGYGLPASTQYSNPERIAGTSREYQSSRSWVKLPQAEPNGLFMPEGLSATWLMMIDPETDKARPVYIEPLIIVSPFKLK